MGIAAYNRGSRSISREAAEGAAVANARAEYRALAEENEQLRARVAQLDADLGRARRCLAAERMGRVALRQRLAAKESAYAFAVSTLCRRAFPDDYVRCSCCNGTTAVRAAGDPGNDVLCEGCLFSRTNP